MTQKSQDPEFSYHSQIASCILTEHDDTIGKVEVRQKSEGPVQRREVYEVVAKESPKDLSDQLSNTPVMRQSFWTIQVRDHEKYMFDPMGEEISHDSFSCYLVGFAVRWSTSTGWLGSKAILVLSQDCL